MRVKVKIFYPSLQQFINKQDLIQVDGSTVGECLEHLAAQFPDIRPVMFGKDGKLLSYLDVYVNGESAYPEELAKPVKAGDEIDLVVMLSGG